MSLSTGVVVPFFDHLGFTLERFEGGESELHYTALPAHMNSFNVTHGGACMTLLDVAMAVAARSVQKDMGVVSALQAFFRSLGGAIGLAVYSTAFSSTVHHELPRRLPASARGQGSDLSKIIRAPAQIKALEEPIRKAVQGAIAAGLRSVFLLSAGLATLAILAAIALPEIPLKRGTPAPVHSD